MNQSGWIHPLAVALGVLIWAAALGPSVYADDHVVEGNYSDVWWETLPKAQEYAPSLSEYDVAKRAGIDCSDVSINSTSFDCKQKNIRRQTYYLCRRIIRYSCGKTIGENSDQTRVAKLLLGRTTEDVLKISAILRTMSIAQILRLYRGPKIEIHSFFRACYKYVRAYRALNKRLAELEAFQGPSRAVFLKIIESTSESLDNASAEWSAQVTKISRSPGSGRDIAISLGNPQLLNDMEKTRCRRKKLEGHSICPEETEAEKRQRLDDATTKLLPFADVK